VRKHETRSNSKSCLFVITHIIQTYKNITVALVCLFVTFLQRYEPSKTWKLVRATLRGKVHSNTAPHKYGTLIKCEVKMAWYWSSSLFFLRVYGPRRSRLHNSQQKERGQYPAILTEQALSIKDLLYGFRGDFSCETQRVIPSGQESAILLARVANQRAGFDSSCLLTELAI